MSVSTLITEGFGVTNGFIVTQGFGATGGGTPPVIVVEPQNESGFVGGYTRITSTRVITVITFEGLDGLAPAT